MDTSSYLFMSHRKRLKLSYRRMEKQSSTDSNISLDSLEDNLNGKTGIKQKTNKDYVDTILVPFYENDVLIKVPKEQKRNVNTAGKPNKPNVKAKKEINRCYLVNKDKGQAKGSSYLDMFRKQFTPNYCEIKKNTNEIRSLSPEFGDTERESIEDNANNEVTEFYNTESYNEIYYEELLNRDFQALMNNSLDDDLQIESSVIMGDQSLENFKSVSEVSNPRRPSRRATIDPVVQGLKLGGLGPDMETIKPRLERARSLQRYSEKVRMENRLKIYKKGVQVENEKKIASDLSSNRQNSGKRTKILQNNSTASYLVNKTGNDKNADIKSANLKSKSADAQKTKERYLGKDQRRKQRSACKKNEQKSETKPKLENKPETGRRNSGKANSKEKSGLKNMGINTESAPVAPVQISFLVNIGGTRPSSALKTLEEKHRMYQEQVKAFMNDNNNG